MCQLCSTGKGACTCRVNCGSSDCKCPAFLTAAFAVRWAAVREAWDRITARRA